MELRHLRYFLALSQELHFSKAARKLNIVQPALSRQIKDLENELGFPLFDRDKRNVHLSTAGEYFRKEVEAIFNTLGEVSQKAKLIAEGLSGEIRIGYVGSAAFKVLPDFAACINKRFPKAQVYLSEDGSTQQVEQVQNGTLDIGFIRNSVSGKNIVRRDITKETFSLVFPATHWLANKKLVSLGQLKNERFILPPRKDGEEYRAHLLSIFQDAGFQPVILHESTHASTIIKLVENNLGISLLPSSYKKITTEKVKFIELSQIQQHSVLTAIWRKESNNKLLKECAKLLPESKN